MTRAELYNLLKKNHLSDKVIFGRQKLTRKCTITPEIELAVRVYINATYLLSFNEFKKKRKLLRGQNWTSEYTKKIKKMLEGE